MTTIKERLAVMQEKFINTDDVLIKHDERLVTLETSRHKHNGQIHTMEGILVGMETMIKDFIKTSEAQAVKTTENTAELRDLRIMGKTFLIMMQWFFVFCGAVGAVGGSKLFGWW